MTKDLHQTLKSIKFWLGVADAEKHEWTIFGSTSLVLRGVLDREPGDVDMFVSRRVWGALLAHDEFSVETPKAGDPPILVYSQSPIVVHMFYDWENEHVLMDVPTLLQTSKFVKGYRCIPVCDALAHKKWALAGDPKLKKHKKDIPVIERWVKDHA